ncbi:MAG: class I SAM-dependent methyltransferase [Desulfohalobium sp.]
MDKDRTRWNHRYRNSPPPERVCPLLPEHVPDRENATALDLAAGTGANSVFLADKGYEVFSVDIADAAIERIQEQNHPRIRPIQADLDTYRPPTQRFDLVLTVRFLDRRLFPYLSEALVPGGTLIIHTLLDDPSRDCPQMTSNRDHLLRPNELLRAFSHLRIVFYREHLSNTECLASLVAYRE